MQWGKESQLIVCVENVNIILRRRVFCEVGAVYIVAVQCTLGGRSDCSSSSRATAVLQRPHVRLVLDSGRRSDDSHAQQDDHGGLVQRPNTAHHRTFCAAMQPSRCHIPTRSTETAHTFAKKRFTSVAIRFRIPIRILDPDHHQNLTICSLAHCQPSLRISCKSVRKFLHKVGNRQTNKQTNNDDYIILLGGGNNHEYIVSTFNVSQARRHTYVPNVSQMYDIEFSY